MSAKIKTPILIIGGGISGLMLALCLERAQVEYVLLEAKNDITYTAGAGFALQHCSCPILDQLGILDDIQLQNKGGKSGVSGNVYYIRVADQAGNVIMSSDLGFSLLHARNGYQYVTHERDGLVRCLVKHNQSSNRLKVGKKVASIEHKADYVYVRCTDGTEYETQVLVGADGVRSVVRQAMWTLAESEGSKQFKGDKKAFKGRYECVTGSAKKFASSWENSVTQHIGNPAGFLAFPGPSNKQFWLLTCRLEKDMDFDKIPRSDPVTAEALANKHRNKPVRIGGKDSVGDIWDAADKRFGFIAEEGFHENWTYGRFVIIGDACHKVEPASGLGGNLAIEDGAALANALVTLATTLKNQSPTSWPLSAVQYRLDQFSKKRKTRCHAMVKVAWSMSERATSENWLKRFIIRYVAPVAGDSAMDIIADRSPGAELLRFLPPPEMVLNIPMPLNPDQGLGHEETPTKRALKALPLFLFWVTTIYGYVSTRQSSSTTRTESEYPIQLYADLGRLYTIMLIESARRASRMTTINIPLVFGLTAQFLRPDLVFPLYFFLFYIGSKTSNFKASDQRLTNLSYTKTVLPTMILSYLIPLIMTSYSSSDDTKSIWNQTWKLFPLLCTFNQYIFKKLGLVADTMKEDRIKNTKRDLPWIFWQVGLVTLASATTHFYSFIQNSTCPPSSPDFQTLFTTTNTPSSVQTTLSASSLLWMLYLLFDLKQAGMIDQSWFIILSMGLPLGALSCLILGPGATVGMGWMWRESILSTRRHKSAITRENWRRRYMEIAERDGGGPELLEDCNGK